MSPSHLLHFLRRELVPTPGRRHATVRLTVACLAATIPIFADRIPSGLLVMVVMYSIAREDTAATVIGSLLSVVGVTIGIGLALLAWEMSLDAPWLRLCFLVAFLFGGLFFQRVLKMGALGMAIGLPAGLAMILPDLDPHPELLVESLLWIWWCVILGLSVNLCVQLLLSRGDPLTLLERELDMRLQAVAQSLRRLAGTVATEPAPTPLSSLAIAGMSRPLAFLKTASMVHPWAGERHEGLATIITLVDRLVTGALALEKIAAASDGRIPQERLLAVADGCDRMRRAFAERRLPEPDEWAVLADEQNTETIFLLVDMERTLDQIALAVPRYSEELGQSKIAPPGKRSLFLPDAFDNPEHVRLAIKGALAALICYLVFIGFDYPGIYTSLITCYVVSLSTIGASNQKGILRFGGAAVGSVMALIALVYLFPNMDTIGGFWLVFGAGTAVATWVNFGSPRISYGGYQIAVAFYKAILGGFGPALSATVVRDRLIGVFFGLIVFGIVEHLLWPVRAQNALRVRLAEMLRLLADLARSGTTDQAPSVMSNDVDALRRRISQTVKDVQGLIESSKFESGDLELDEIQKRTGDAQIVFVLLLALARHPRDVAQSNVVRTAEDALEGVMATALEALSKHTASGSEPTVPDLENALNSFERSMTGTDALDKEAATYFAGRLALYRLLVAAINRLSSAISEYRARHTSESLLERGVFFEGPQTRTN